MTWFDHSSYRSSTDPKQVFSLLLTARQTTNDLTGPPCPPNDAQPTTSTLSGDSGAAMARRTLTLASLPSHRSTERFTDRQTLDWVCEG